MFCSLASLSAVQALLFLLAVGYVGIVALSALGVGAGIDDHMTAYSGQVRVNKTNYTVTNVKAATLKLRCAPFHIRRSARHCSTSNEARVSHFCAGPVG